MLAEDGSGKGAGMVAAIASRIEKRKSHWDANIFLRVNKSVSVVAKFAVIIAFPQTSFLITIL